MNRKSKIHILTALSLLMLGISSSVDAFILREYTLDEVIKTCSNVAFGKVAAIDQEKMRFVVDQVENVRGKGRFKRMKISLAIAQGDFSERLIGKLHADAPIVIFYIPVGQERIEALGYVSGIWIRLFAVRGDPDNFKWYFTHIEKYMNRTFHGDILKLQSLIRDVRSEGKQNEAINIDAFVRRRYTLREMVAACGNVMSGKVTSIDLKKMRVVVGNVKRIKGKEKPKQMNINLVTGQANSAKQLMSKLSNGAPAIILYVPVSGKRIEALGYVSGLWIRLFAVYDKSGAMEWYFAHIEKYMNHVFDGDALKLRSLIQEMVAEKTRGKKDEIQN